MNSCRRVRLSDSVLRVTENTARNRLPLCVLGLSAVLSGTQLPATHTEPAMQCAEISKRPGPLGRG